MRAISKNFYACGKQHGSLAVLSVTAIVLTLSTSGDPLPLTLLFITVHLRLVCKLTTSPLTTSHQYTTLVSTLRPARLVHTLRRHHLGHWTNTCSRE